MDKTWDRKSFEVGGNLPFVAGMRKKRMTTQNRQKSKAKKNKKKLRFKHVFLLNISTTNTHTTDNCWNKLQCQWTPLV